MDYCSFKRIFVCCLAGILVVFGGSAGARENILQGSVSLGNDYNSNVFQTHTERTEEWQTAVSPELSLHSTGSNDSMVVEYAPDFSYNHRRDDQETMQDVTVSGKKSFSPHWQVSLSDNYNYLDSPVFETDNTLSLAQQFLRADAATRAEIVRLLFPELVWDPELHLTQVLSEFQQRYDAAPALQPLVNSFLVGGGPDARQRYWTNSFAFESIHKLAPNSTLRLGYNFETHDNQTGVLSDRTQHSPSLLFSYQFNPQWGMELGYLFETVNLDSSDDSKAHNPNLEVDFQQAPNSKMYLSYDYDAVNYDGATSDMIDQVAVAGWEYGLDPRTNIDSSVTTSYLAQDTQADQRGISFDARLSRNIERGMFSVSGDYRFRESSLQGSWQKLSRSWGMSGDVEYTLSRDASLNFEISYDRRLNWDASRVKDTYDDFQLGAGLNYTFLRWFTLQLGYEYHLFDTSSAILEDYNEHLLSIKLVAAKELWRW